jgi:hypothetical protein
MIEQWSEKLRALISCKLRVWHAFYLPNAALQRPRGTPV